MHSALKWTPVCIRVGETAPGRSATPPKPQFIALPQTMQSLATQPAVARVSARAAASRSAGPARVAQPRQSLKRGVSVVPRAAGTGALMRSGFRR